MFVLSSFKVEDKEEIKQFIQKQSFATIVTIKDEKPIATHLPLELMEEGEDWYLVGHFAYKNPQWKTIEGGNDNILVMYQGPHAYISSSWYEKEDVPTWNYQAVHLYGRGEIMSEEELEESLIFQLKKHEQFHENPVLWDKLSERTKMQKKAIVGVKVKVEEVQAAYKMGQNRSERDYDHIMEKLFEEEDKVAHQLAEEMKRKDVIFSTVRCGSKIKS